MGGGEESFAGEGRGGVREDEGEGEVEGKGKGGELRGSLGRRLEYGWSRDF